MKICAKIQKNLEVSKAFLFFSVLFREIEGTGRTDRRKDGVGFST